MNKNELAVAVCYLSVVLLQHHCHRVKTHLQLNNINNKKQNTGKKGISLWKDDFVCDLSDSETVINPLPEYD
jgi:hypothetical protein